MICETEPVISSTIASATAMVPYSDGSSNVTNGGFVDEYPLPPLSKLIVLIPSISATADAPLPEEFCVLDEIDTFGVKFVLYPDP